jgi:hypothetical protein
MDIVAATLTAQFGSAKVDAEQELVLLQVAILYCFVQCAPTHSTLIHLSPVATIPPQLADVERRWHGCHLLLINLQGRCREYRVNRQKLCIFQVDGVDVVVDHQAGKVDCTDPGLQVRPSC